MPSPLIVAVLLGGLGLIVGLGLARVSVRLPRDPDEGAEPPIHWRSLVSPRYVLVAIAAAAIGVWAAVAGSTGPAVAAAAVLGWQLLLIAIVDAEHFWLPDVLTWPLAGTGLIAAAVLIGGVPWASLIGAVVGFAGLWALARLYRRLRGRAGLGGGDPFLFGAAGAWVGWTGLPSVLMTACAAGLAVVLLRLLFGKPVRGDDRMPFGTLLALGLWLTWLVRPVAG